MRVYLKSLSRAVRRGRDRRRRGSAPRYLRRGQTLYLCKAYLRLRVADRRSRGDARVDTGRTERGNADRIHRRHRDKASRREVPLEPAESIPLSGTLASSEKSSFCVSRSAMPVCGSAL